MKDFNLHPSGKENGLNVESQNEESAPHDVSMSSRADVCLFVNHHYERTFAYCFRLCGRRSDAEDLCQQVFFAAIKYLSQIRSRESAPAWLAITARRLYWKSLRESSQRNVVPKSHCLEHESKLDSYETKLEREDWVEHAMNQLSPLARIMVMMYYFEEKSYQQISDELEIPIGTVMSRLSRSKEMLREALLKTAEPLAIEKNK